MRKTLSVAAAVVIGLGSLVRGDVSAFRPPSVPLVTHDPYFSIWSNADKLTDDVTRHWTRVPMTLTGLIRIDGQTFRVIGESPDDLPALKQTSTKVWPTRTVCTFESDTIKLTLTFLTPALPTDLELMSTPITAILWDVTSVDGKSHDVSVFLGAGSDLARNDKAQEVKLVPADKDAKVIKLGTVEQPILERRGDGVRIDWGYACLGGSAKNITLAGSEGDSVISRFQHNGNLTPRPDDDTPAPGTILSPTLGAVVTLGSVGASPVSGHVLLGYDDDKSIDYMGHHLVGYWKKDGATIEQAFEKFEKNLADIKKRCEEFDEKLMKALTEVGGEKYAAITALAHRQSLAAAKVCADANGMPLMFSKENNSNGCIATVDVFFPQIPHLLLLNPDLAKASVQPLLEYGGSKRWPWPYAPHDLGTYPQATGQVYGGGEKTEDGQMPVEECGNILLIVGGISKADGNAEFAKRYWPILTQWAKYLEEHGVDPANQLCTDDFAGHLARNANLSVKAIMGMGSYAMMADMLGEKEVANHYRNFARESAKKWMEMADAGDHYSLAFGKPDTWSQKYNLVWDDVLDIDIFPKEVKQKELAFYKTKINPYGLPLDSRRGYTKSDWQIWTATLADDRETFNLIADPVYKFANETNQRLPFSDWYETEDARFVGFIARPVIGGLFMPMLKDEKVWLEWSKQATPVKGDWAPMPVPPPPPQTAVVVAHSKQEPQTWRYTFQKPADNWTAVDFDDKGWKEGQAGFGTPGTPGAVNKTRWDTDDIWMRRTVNIPAEALGGELRLEAHHDEDLTVYIDGKPLVRKSGFSTDYYLIKIGADQQKLVTPGEHTLAVHCKQTGGGQYVDVGIVKIIPADK